MPETGSWAVRDRDGGRFSLALAARRPLSMQPVIFSRGAQICAATRVASLRAARDPQPPQHFLLLSVRGRGRQNTADHPTKSPPQRRGRENWKRLWPTPVYAAASLLPYQI